MLFTKEEGVGVVSKSLESKNKKGRNVSVRSHNLSEKNKKKNRLCPVCEC